MSVKAKYQPVVDLGLQLGIREGDVREEAGILKIQGLARTQYEKNILWDKIKAIGGEHPSDIRAGTAVEDTLVCHRHPGCTGPSQGRRRPIIFGR